MTITNQPDRPVMRYHGGKWRLAPWIISHFPEHRIYTEAFGGAGSVLMRKPRSYAEVYNDLNSSVVNVFRVLRDPVLASQLEAACRHTPFSREEFSTTSLESGHETDPVEAARQTLFRAAAGFGSTGGFSEAVTGFRANVTRSHTTPAHDWASWPDLIETFSTRLRGVVIENMPAAELLAKYDHVDALHYVDPPYVQDTRSVRWKNGRYRFEMNDDDHASLASALKRLDGMVVVSGYSCPLYDDLFGDWERLDRAAHTERGGAKVESLWLNLAAAGRGQMRFDMERPLRELTATKDTSS